MTDISTGRPATLAPNGLVTSPHSLASAAGVDVLRAGGSAIDAAVAASAVLSVVYPHMTSIGGDAFWLIYDAVTRKVRYVDGGGRAAASGTIEAFTKRGLSEVPLKGAAARHAHRAGRGRELDRGARRLRPPAAEALPGERHRLCARRLSGDGAPGALARPAAQRAGEEPRGGGDLPQARPRAHQSRPRAHARGDRRRRLVRLL